jgi:proteasome accessory factor C
VAKFDRIYDLHRLLAGRRTPIALSDLMERLNCSRSTALRLVSLLKDQLGAPIDFDRDLGGYRYQPGPDGRAYELAGLDCKH